MRVLKMAAGLLASASILAGCSTTSGSFPGYSDDPMAATMIVQNPDFNGGRVAPEAVETINRYGAYCTEKVLDTVAGLAQSALNGAVTYGPAGAIGGATGLEGGAQAAFAGISPGTYAIYGGIAGAAQGVTGGAVNGATMGSNSAAYARGDCVRLLWSDVEESKPEYDGTHVLIITGGKRRDAPSSAPRR